MGFASLYPSYKLLRSQPVKVPKRSLKRSSRPGARTSGLCPDNVVLAGAVEVVDATEFAGATEVSDELLPHNSCTAGEIGCVRSPAWNSERKIGSDATEAVCDVAATGVTLL